MLLSILLHVYLGSHEIEYLGALSYPYCVDLKIFLNEIEFTHNTINIDFIMLLVPNEGHGTIFFVSTLNEH